MVIDNLTNIFLIHKINIKLVDQLSLSSDNKPIRSKNKIKWNMASLTDYSVFPSSIPIQLSLVCYIEEDAPYSW